MTNKYDAEALATAADYYGLPLGVDDDCLRKSFAYSQALLRLHCKDLTAPAVRLAKRLAAAFKRWVDR